jgi:hypothetical protein
VPEPFVGIGNGHGFPVPASLGCESLPADIALQTPSYLLVLFVAAQRFFWAAAMRALPSSLMTRFFVLTAGTGGTIFFGRPTLFLDGAAIGVVSVRSARAACRRPISESIAESISLRFMEAILSAQIGIERRAKTDSQGCSNQRTVCRRHYDASWDQRFGSLSRRATGLQRNV